MDRDGSRPGRGCAVGEGFSLRGKIFLPRERRHRPRSGLHPGRPRPILPPATLTAGRLPGPTCSHPRPGSGRARGAVLLRYPRSQRPAEPQRRSPAAWPGPPRRRSSLTPDPGPAETPPEPNPLG